MHFFLRISPRRGLPLYVVSRLVLAKLADHLDPGEYIHIPVETLYNTQRDDGFVLDTHAIPPRSGPGAPGPGPDPDPDPATESAPPYAGAQVPWPEGSVSV